MGTATIPHFVIPMLIIEGNHITKEYRLGQLQSLKHSLQRAATKLRDPPVPKRTLFSAQRILL